MRIVSGKYRGRAINPPKNLRARPTTDFARENLFNVLGNLVDFEECDVLDLFAGTGQLGIECLSRGAESAVFVDKDRAAVQIVRDNLKTCGLKATVLQEDAQSFLRHCGKFDVIFVDPPYDSGLYESVLETINSVDILSNGGIIICEARRERQLPDMTAPYAKRKEYSYGKVKVCIYTKENA